MFHSFAKPFQSPIPSISTAVAWYLSGGIAAANCIGAYRAKGAASLSASYTNLANVGTYTLTVGLAPSWSSAVGWTFLAANGNYLKTGIVPANNQTWSAIVAYNGFTDATKTNYALGVYNGTGKLIALAPNSSNGGDQYSNGGTTLKTATTSGVNAFAGNKMFHNGSALTGTIGAGSGSITSDFYIGALNANGSPSGYSTGNITALAIYNTVLTDAQVAALTTAMNAL